MRACRFVTRAVAVAALVSTVVPVGAVGASGDADGYVDEEGDPTAEANLPGTPDTETPGTPGDDDDEPECWFEVVVADDTVTKVFNQFGMRRYSETGRWLMQVCEDIGPVAYNGMPVFPEGGSVDPGELAEQARESVPIASPSAMTSPAAGRLVVQMPTWLWVDGGWWQEYTATATAGRVSATATATPTRAVWSTGDGRVVECGAGMPWSPGAVAGEVSCVHTYTRVSPPGGFELSVTVEFAVSWTSNVGEGGDLGTIQRTAGQAVQVGEIQAVGTR